MSEILEGGREKIYREGDIVVRPADKWTKDIHLFLQYLHDNGFDKVPYPHGIDEEGRERVGYVKGEVHNGILPEEVRSDETLIDIAKMQRRYHDLGEKYIKNLRGDEEWMLTKQEPVEVMCHGDLAPYNIAMDGKEVVGIIDFDTLHPGPRLWDIAYTVYRSVPLMDKENEEDFGTEEDKERRLNLFIEAYGLEGIDKKTILEWVIKRVEGVVNFMKVEAEKGNETFKKHIEEGHLETYLKDLEYLKGRR